MGGTLGATETNQDQQSTSTNATNQSGTSTNWGDMWNSLWSGFNTTNTTNQQTGAWNPAAGYFPDVYAKAKAAMDATTGKTYTAPTLAGPTANQQAGANALAGAASTVGSTADPLRQYATSLLRGDWLSPDTNPHIKAVADAAVGEVKEDFDQALQGTKSRAIMAGAYGGSRQDLQEREALNQFTKTAGNVASNIYNQNYMNERNAMGAAGQLAGLADTMAVLGPQTLLTAGGIQQGWQQAAMDDAKRRWEEQQAAPWKGIQEMLSVLTGGGYTSTTGTQTSSGTQESGEVGGNSSASTNTGTGTTTSNSSGTGNSTTYTDPLTLILQALVGGAVGGKALKLW